VLRIRDVYPGSRILIFTYPGSRIPDPKTATKERGEKKICCHNFLCSHKNHKIANYFSFEVLKKKKLAQFSKNYRTFYPKNCQHALKNMGLGSGIGDPGSGKNLFRIPDPDPQHCFRKANGKQILADFPGKEGWTLDSGN
jgi:hypothetical protein